MSSVTCVICGARKGITNDWWVLFEAESGRAVWIGRAEDAQTEHPWKPTTVPFHLCGVECLYRRLNALLLPRWVGGLLCRIRQRETFRSAPKFPVAGLCRARRDHHDPRRHRDGCLDLRNLPG